MDKVVIRHFQEEPCILYDNDDNEIGVIDNYLTFLDVRVQLLKNNLEGYYVIFKDQRIDIIRGRCKKNIFPLTSIKLCELIHLRK